MNTQRVIAHTQNWISSMVIGLNLCPFAEPGFRAGLIRYAVTPAADGAELAVRLAAELALLAETPSEEILTTLLIHPNALPDFYDFNEFTGVAEALVRRRGLEGVLQVVGFHPGFQFSGTAEGDAENFTNRSPYPTLHLLREASITAVSGPAAGLLEIPKRNVARLKALGREKILARLKGCVPDGSDR